MPLIPPLTTKPLSQASAGELVQIPWQADHDLVLTGIVSKDAKDRPGLVCLVRDAPEAAPGYLPFSSPTVGRIILSYGFDYSFHIPPGARTAPYEHDLAPSGVMLIGPGDAIIRAAPMSKSVSGGFYNIATRDLLDTDAPHLERWTVFDWDLRLNLSPPTAPPLLSYRAPNARLSLRPG